MDEQRSDFVGWNLLLAKTLWIFLKRQSYSLKFYKNYKGVEGFKNTDFKLEKFCFGQNVTKQHWMLHRKFLWKKRESNDLTIFNVLFLKIATITSSFRNHHPSQSAVINIESRTSISKILWLIKSSFYRWFSFNNKVLYVIYIAFFRSFIITQC
jgi:hypothetical protein